MESKRFAAREKRAVFRRRVGEIVLKKGFLLKNDRFYRIDMNGTIMMFVELVLMPSGSCDIRYTIRPFCAKLSTDAFKYAVRQTWAIIIKSDHEKARRLIGAPFLEIYEALHEAFFSEVFDRMDAIKSVEDCYDFQEWYLQAYEGGSEHDYMGHVKMWECIQMKNYDRAKYHAMQELERIIRNDYGGYIKWREMERKDTLDDVELLKKKAKKNEEYMDDLRKYIHMLENGEHEYLDEKVKERIEFSKASVQQMFPRI